MKFIVEGHNFSIKVSLTVLRIAGLWAPDDFGGWKLFLYHCYTFLCLWFFIITYVIIQVVDMYQVRGDLALMTGAAFLLFTNLAHSCKILNILVRRRRVGRLVERAAEGLGSVVLEEEVEIIKRCNRETSLLLRLYLFMTTITAIGWAVSSEKNHLPLPRAWYPYDTNKSPAFELTFLHQITALYVSAMLNIAKDTLVTGIMAQNRCQLQLLKFRLRNIHKGLDLDDKTVDLLSPALERCLVVLRCVKHHQRALRQTPESVSLLPASLERVSLRRVRRCARHHQRALRLAPEVQACFSGCTFAQFAVSLAIICVTAFQLSQTKNLVRFLSMGTYLLNMSLQVFIYCYQGNQLSEESLTIADAAYECLWYRSSVALRRSLLLVMTRARRPLVITAGGFTDLLLSSFMGIIKASYSYFTVLKQVTQE